MVSARWDAPENARVSGDYRLTPVLGILGNLAIAVWRADGTGGVQAWITARATETEDSVPQRILEEARAMICAWEGSKS